MIPVLSNATITLWKRGIFWLNALSRVSLCTTGICHLRALPMTATNLPEKLSVVTLYTIMGVKNKFVVAYE